MTENTRLEDSCSCCADCAHPEVADAQYGPCVACEQSVSGKPRDGTPPLRSEPRTVRD